MKLNKNIPGLFPCKEGERVEDVASFPGPDQLSITCSTEKQYRAWNNNYHMSDVEGREKIGID